MSTTRSSTYDACSRCDARSSICDACAADLLPETTFATPVTCAATLMPEAAFATLGGSICDACAADWRRLQAAFATPVQQIQHLQSLSKQHLRRRCSRFAAGSSIRDACKQHLRRLCSVRSSIYDACAADSAPAKPVKAAFAMPVQQICCQKQHSRRL